jgi:hypothetical protein
VAGLGFYGCNDTLRRCNDHILGISLERIRLARVAQAAAEHDVGLVKRQGFSKQPAGSVQNLSHIWSGDGFGLRDLRLIERPHVHVALG